MFFYVEIVVSLVRKVIHFQGAFQRWHSCAKVLNTKSKGPYRMPFRFACVSLFFLILITKAYLVCIFVIERFHIQFQPFVILLAKMVAPVINRTSVIVRKTMTVLHVNYLSYHRTVRVFPTRHWILGKNAIQGE